MNGASNRVLSDALGCAKGRGVGVSQTILGGVQLQRGPSGTEPELHWPNHACEAEAAHLQARPIPGLTKGNGIR